MDASTAYRINQPKVVHEVFDDEVVLVNFDTGFYYSFDKVGADIWVLIEKGWRVGAIVDELAVRYDAPRPALEESARTFIDRLLAENLICSHDAASASASGGAPASPSGAKPAAPRVFSAPVLNKYSDMQQLLLLDPIHEVDESGWPNES